MKEHICGSKPKGFNSKFSNKQISTIFTVVYVYLLSFYELVVAKYYCLQNELKVSNIREIYILKILTANIANLKI